MPFSFDHYTIKSTTEHELYTYIEASYDREPTRCSNKNCDCRFFSSQGESSAASHKICFLSEKKPKVMNAKRIRWECLLCETSFYADAEETSEWDSDIGNNFRNYVINYWLRSKIISIYKCAALFGIDRSKLTEWEDKIAHAFYANQIIEGYEELYFGQFKCYKDDTPHAFIAETEYKYGGLVGFIREYNENGLTSDVKTRFIDTDKVMRIRFDYEPGIEETLRVLFPNADCIECNAIIDEYEKGETPRWAIVADIIRKRINKRVGKKHRFNSIMLQMMYNNERWKEKVQDAGAQAGYIIQDITVGSWKPKKKTIHRYDGNEKTAGFEIPENLIEEYDQEDSIDEGGRPDVEL